MIHGIRKLTLEIKRKKEKLTFFQDLFSREHNTSVARRRISIGQTSFTLATGEFVLSSSKTARKREKNKTKQNRINSKTLSLFLWISHVGSLQLFPKNESAEERWHASRSRPVSSKQHKIAPASLITFHPGLGPSPQPSADLGIKHPSSKHPAMTLLSFCDVSAF